MVAASTALGAADDVVLCDADGRSVVVTLPDPVGSVGHEITIKRISTGAGSCAVSGVWAGDSSGPLALAAPTTDGEGGDVVVVVCDGSDWYVLARG